MFGLCCDVGNKVSQGEPEPRTEAILSPLNLENKTKQKAYGRV